MHSLSTASATHSLASLSPAGCILMGSDIRERSICAYSANVHSLEKALHLVKDDVQSGGHDFRQTREKDDSCLAEISPHSSSSSSCTWYQIAPHLPFWACRDDFEGAGRKLLTAIRDSSFPVVGNSSLSDDIPSFHLITNPPYGKQVSLDGELPVAALNT